jgi:hypothetical protein
MMPPDDELDELERTLDPMARFVISHLRKDNALLREQLEKNGELVQRLTEQVDALNRRLFGSLLCLSLRTCSSGPRRGGSPRPMRKLLDR